MSSKRVSASWEHADLRFQLASDVARFDDLAAVPASSPFEELTAASSARLATIADLQVSRHAGLSGQHAAHAHPAAA